MDGIMLSLGPSLLPMTVLQSVQSASDKVTLCHSLNQNYKLASSTHLGATDLRKYRPMLRRYVLTFQY